MNPLKDYDKTNRRTKEEENIAEGFVGLPSIKRRENIFKDQKLKKEQRNITRYTHC
jgi:hypothetical protein